MGVMQSAHPLIVYLAAPRGFCAGVDRAIEIVEQALKLYGPPIYVRHEIVHNRWVVEDLRSMGVVFVKEVHEIPVDRRHLPAGNQSTYSGQTL